MGQLQTVQRLHQAIARVQETEKETEDIFKAVMSENFPKLM